MKFNLNGSQTSDFFLSDTLYFFYFCFIRSADTNLLLKRWQRTVRDKSLNSFRNKSLRLQFYNCCSIPSNVINCWMYKIFRKARVYIESEQDRQCMSLHKWRCWRGTGQWAWSCCRKWKDNQYPISSPFLPRLSPLNCYCHFFFIRPCSYRYLGRVQNKKRKTNDGISIIEVLTPPPSMMENTK